VHDLLGRVDKDSHNSSKPLSSDGYAKKTRSLRQKGSKKPGGQKGHAGNTRSFVEPPDEVIIVRPETCARCRASLQGVPAPGCQRHQKVDLPEIKVQVTEYQAQDVLCPHCQYVTRGTFPQEIRASIQFGPTVKGIALYLLYGQFLPYARTAELLTDLCGCHLSPGLRKERSDSLRQKSRSNKLCEKQESWELTRRGCESKACYIGCIRRRVLLC
jgi:transposase